MTYIGNEIVKKKPFRFNYLTTLSLIGVFPRRSVFRHAFAQPINKGNQIQNKESKRPPTLPVFLSDLKYMVFTLRLNKSTKGSVTNASEHVPILHGSHKEKLVSPKAPAISLNNFKFETYTFRSHK